MAWLSGWTHRIPISFDRSAIATATRPVIVLPCAEGTLGWDGVVASDLSNARITGSDGTTLWDWWAEYVDTAHTSIIHTRPASTLPGSTSGVIAYLYWRATAAASNANEANTFQDCFARYGLAEASGTVYDGTSNNWDSSAEANISYQANDRYSVPAAMEMNGTDSKVTFGDVTQFNAAAAFTGYFWLKQDVLDQNDVIFEKSSADGVTTVIRLWTTSTGNLACVLNTGGAKRGEYDYSQAVSAGEWFHVAFVFNGAGADNAARLKLYVNGAAKTLSYTGSIAATLPNVAGRNLTMGQGVTVDSFDGIIDEARFFAVAAGADDIMAAYGAQATGGGSLISFGSIEQAAFAGDIDFLHISTIQLKPQYRPRHRLIIGKHSLERNQDWVILDD